ncbi:hypothetical protein BDB00DRAFT_96035 [Zychaea mexicana]|uniref:uncharacterized protein n=1 Tax=Zychaea mexicana TaxID=64656 RepID=UPI0022FF0847|nr:uncharacterized protein BDB00DRAFT_96035 [Zychaea mexicana]KAI9484958.1 hypothetical protein BDB00DRAFT_96035 [Zychaea mexicana]
MTTRRVCTWPGRTNCSENKAIDPNRVTADLTILAMTTVAFRMTMNSNTIQPVVKANRGSHVYQLAFDNGHHLPPLPSSFSSIICTCALYQDNKEKTHVAHLFVCTIRYTRLIINIESFFFFKMNCLCLSYSGSRDGVAYTMWWSTPFLKGMTTYPLVFLHTMDLCIIHRVVFHPYKNTAESKRITPPPSPPK